MKPVFLSQEAQSLSSKGLMTQLKFLLGKIYLQCVRAPQNISGQPFVSASRTWMLSTWGLFQFVLRSLSISVSVCGSLINPKFYSWVNGRTSPPCPLPAAILQGKCWGEAGLAAAIFTFLKSFFLGTQLYLLVFVFEVFVHYFRVVFVLTTAE